MSDGGGESSRGGKLFSVAKRGLDLALLGNVAKHQHHTDQLALRILDRRCAIVDGNLGTVAPAQYGVVGKADDGPGANDLRHWIFRRLTRDFVEDRKNLGSVGGPSASPPK